MVEECEKHPAETSRDTLYQPLKLGVALTKQFAGYFGKAIWMVAEPRTPRSPIRARHPCCGTRKAMYVRDTSSVVGCVTRRWLYGACIVIQPRKAFRFAIVGVSILLQSLVGELLSAFDRIKYFQGCMKHLGSISCV